MVFAGVWIFSWEAVIEKGIARDCLVMVVMVAVVVVMVLVVLIAQTSDLASKECGEVCPGHLNRNTPPLTGTGIYLANVAVLKQPLSSPITAQRNIRPLPLYLIT